MEEMTHDSAQPVAASADLTPDLPRRSWLGRLKEGLKRTVEPVLAGFREHAWSGKLYLLTSALGVLTSFGGAVSFVLLLAFTSNMAYPGGLLPIAGVVAFTGWLQWKLLSGVARFRNWARRIAIVVSGFALLGGINMMVFLGSSRMLILGAAQAALSLQFIAYFVRERDRFLDSGEE